jgi:starch synthase
VKTGGLGDVVGALPKVLRRMGLDARVVLPLYSSIDRERFRLQFVSSACIHMGHGEENWVGIYSSLLDDEVHVWFVDYDRFFGRPGIYHDGAGEYLDNAYRFALISKAALQICKDQNFIPEVMHCHDWPTSLVPVFLKTWDRILSPLSNTATVLTIHNIGYQGVYDPSVMRYLGLGDEHYRSDTLEDHGKVNLLKAGVAFADALTTVSPTHAVEILDPVGGCGLAPYLERRRGDLTGILNGVDEEHWNPSSDKLIPARFSASDMSGKIECKRELQRRFGLKVDDSVPLFGVITRFAHQKGMDLLIEASRPALDRMALQLVVLGSGDRHVEDYFRWLPSAYPGRVGSYIGFSNELSHLIEAGSDFFLMPSFYEPCGLNQMYSLKYGTLPVVRATGGLNDSVENYDERTGEGTGFKFFLPTGEALHDTIGWAVSTWFDRPHHIQAMRKRGMEKRFGWENSARKYVEVYRAAIRKKVG